MSWKDVFPQENRYFETDNGILYCGDCLEIMKKFPDKSVDLCLTDPPYGIQINKMQFVNSTKGGVAKREDYRGLAEWDNDRIKTEYFSVMFEISKNQIFFGGNYYADILPISKGWLIWDKRVEDRYRNDFADCEIAWMSLGVSRVYRWLWSGMIQQDMKNKEKRFHPTQKPVGLFIKILKDYSNDESLIFDPFLGSGTTGVACEKLGRRWIGIEISEKFCEIAKKRILAEANQMKLW